MSSAVTNLRRQFVQRRLWPVAILLVAALAAVPFALAKDPAPPEPASPVPTTSANADGELATQPIVAQAEPGTTRRRKVLGSAKNPFGIAKQGNEPSSTEDSTVVNVADTGSTGSDTGGSSPSSSGTDTPAPTATAPTTTTTPATPAPAPKKYEQYELTVRFGGAEEAKRQSVKKLQPLPSAELPVLIYMGVSKDGKSAIFLVDQGVTPVGDGDCKPSPEECETIRLRAGETEFLDVTDDTGAATQQYQLDLIKIHKSSSASASSAKASRATLKSGARKSELRSVAGRVSAFLP